MIRKNVMPLLGGILLGLFSCNVTSAYHQGILWQISSDKTEPSYVFGTFHSDDEAILDLPVKVRKALYFSSVLVLEMSLDPDSLNVMKQAAVLPRQDNLKQIINDDLIYSEVVSSMALRGSPRSLTNRMKPWAVYMSLNSPESQSGIFQDLLLQVLASVQNKPVAALEQAHEQVRVYDGLSEPEQVQLLEAMLVDKNQVSREIELTRQHYLEGNLQKLQQVASTDNLDVPKPLRSKIQRRLVDDRNDVMVDRMRPFLERGDAFIAVGALHLPGERGILSRLSDNGYSVTRVH